MSRTTALLLDSPTADQSGIELPATTRTAAGSLRVLTERAHDAWQMAVVFLYLIAAMTPQVRRALSALDKG